MMTRADDSFAESGNNWIEASRPLHPGIPVWPGDQDFELRQRRESGFVLSSITTTCHVGTHLDAPLHLDQAASGVDGVPINHCVGRAEVVRVSIGIAALNPAALPKNWVPAAPRVLVRTDSYPIDGSMEEGFTGLSAELVHWLADRGVETVGIDTPSVDVYDSEDLPAHHALLELGMTWIEGLWLGGAEAGFYEMIALPILLEGAEAAPVRAVLKPISFES